MIRGYDQSIASGFVDMEIKRLLDSRKTTVIYNGTDTKKKKTKNDNTTGDSLAETITALLRKEYPQ